MYDSHPAATGSGALVIGSVVPPWWPIALLRVRLYSLATLRDNGWGTRRNVEVSLATPV
ncbi:hypothetical protein GT204_26855 [Streptomyces sp. SID4919]|uniref:hypothetical protein n=1 Tax=unclassified Streptomyces TaxID=2593676 RepID=UPI000823C527|nr:MULTISPECIES: hypothetical protein [unclassified Streptomyces]MYY12428.1 hypothetical protein [Streptomyces sp. SID4919]SCK54534.1 hypothetical protein YW7DRAFT_05013 [Streptomyces sp. AmelKG-E11A]